MCQSTKVAAKGREKAMSMCLPQASGDISTHRPMARHTAYKALGHHPTRTKESYHSSQHEGEDIACSFASQGINPSLPALMHDGSTRLKRQSATAGMLGKDDSTSTACTVAPAARGSRMLNRLPKPGLPACPAQMMQPNLYPSKSPTRGILDLTSYYFFIIPLPQ